MPLLRKGATMVPGKDTIILKKPGNPEYTSVGAYQPRTLLSCLSKISSWLSACKCLLKKKITSRGSLWREDLRDPPPTPASTSSSGQETDGPRLRSLVHSLRTFRQPSQQSIPKIYTTHWKILASAQAWLGSLLTPSPTDWQISNLGTISHPLMLSP